MKRLGIALSMVATLWLMPGAAAAESAADFVQTMLEALSAAPAQDGTAYMEPKLAAAYKKFVATKCEQVYSLDAWIDGPNRQITPLKDNGKAAQVRVHHSNGDQTTIVYLQKAAGVWKVYDACAPDHSGCYRAYVVKAKCE